MLFKELVELTKSDPMIEVLLPLDGIGKAKVQKYKENWLQAFRDGEGCAPAFAAAHVKAVYPVDDTLQVSVDAEIEVCNMGGQGDETGTD